MSFKKIRSRPPLWPLLVLGYACSDGHAQTELPTVTVTANKQTQTLEALPASVTVFKAHALDAAGASSLETLEQMTPGLAFQPFGQSGIHAPVMRGLTANFFSFSSSTLLLVDGVPTLMAQGYDDRLLGIDRIEVLHGPQSTLYGRNAESGVINIYSRLPGNTPRSMVSAELGSRDLHSLRFDLSRPLIADTLSASVAGELFSQDGFIDNLATTQKEDTRERHHLKLALRWTPGQQTDAILRYTQQDYRDGGALWGSPAAARYTVNSGTPSWNKSRGRSISLDVTHEFSSGVHLRSITARNDFLDRVLQDTDFKPQDTLHIGRDHHFRNLSQELRLEGKFGLAQWLAGFYTDQDDHDLLNEQKLPMGLSKSMATLTGHSTAVFTHWTIPLAERWDMVAGARIERNLEQFQPAASKQLATNSMRWTQATPKLALQYQLTPNSQMYASMTEGFRAGGFNVFTPAANYAAFQPESVRSLEVGIKGILMQRRLRYAAAWYAMNVRDMQVQQMPVPGLVYITNASSARSSGAEFELDYLLGQGWQIQAGLGLNHTRFNTFRDGSNIYDGHRNPFAPDINGHASLRYEAPQGWYAQAMLTGTGKVYLDAANRYSRNGYGLLNLAAGTRVGAFEISAYVNNLANRQYDALGFQNGIVTVYSPPRQMGLKLVWRM
ncbi:TonB-dependent receptor [Undibacterium sp. JH2W]|uniref:TonB-dependent receptor n=1 Tax=Undibacterium sp. JH2W TaxID=3413037 RepID=UPI003BF31F2C